MTSWRMQRKTLLWSKKKKLVCPSYDERVAQAVKDAKAALQKEVKKHEGNK